MTDATQDPHDQQRVLRNSRYDKFLRRLARGFTDEQQRKILLAQLFSCVAVAFIMVYAISALLDGNIRFALALLIFISLTMINYFYLLLARQANVASLNLISLMATVSVYLFYTGGIAETGPIWSLVFIPVAIFLGGLKRGVIASLLLLAIQFALFRQVQEHMHTDMYSNTFMVRLASVYVILILLAGMNEYFRTGTQLYLESANRRLDTLFRTDELTGLYNRRHIMEQLAYEALRMQRKNTPLSVIIFDIDHFKVVNDLYGHACGDYVLQCVAQIVRKITRAIDITARIGGEEFLLLLPDTHLHGAAIVAERLRREMEQYHFTYGNTDFNVTLSLGVTEASHGFVLDELLRIADDNLYRAKNRGRNRMVAA